MIPAVEDGIRYSFTGPSRGVDIKHGLLVYEAIKAEHERRPGREFNGGCAYGIDTYASLSAAAVAPEAVHRLLVPAAPHNDALVADGGKYGFVVQRAATGSTDAESYMLRNDLLVDTDVLLAFLWSAQFYRSGEWATVNRARRRGVEVIETILPRKVQC